MLNVSGPHDAAPTPPLPPNLAADLLDALACGQLVAAAQLTALHDPPPVYQQLRDDPTWAADLDDQQVTRLLTSWAGPLAASHLVGSAAGRDPANWLPTVAATLAAAPLSQGRLLLAAHRSLTVREVWPLPGLLDAAAVRLEQLTGQLPDTLSSCARTAVGLPVTLGLLFDLRVRCYERGAALRADSSGAQPLLLAMESLGVRTVADLLTVELSDDGGPLVVPAVLAALTSQYTQLGARAAATRAAILALRLPGTRHDDAVTARQILRKLVIRRRTYLPGELVPAVWKLAHDVG